MKPDRGPSPSEGGGETPNRYFAVWSALSAVIDAYEALPGGTHYRPSEIQRWIDDHVHPAIDNARRVMNRKRPDGSEP